MTQQEQIINWTLDILFFYIFLLASMSQTFSLIPAMTISMSRDGFLLASAGEGDLGYLVLLLVGQVDEMTVVDITVLVAAAVLMEQTQTNQDDNETHAIVPTHRNNSGLWMVSAS